MPEVNKSVLVEHSAQEMFDLVDEVERYPEFMPWCGGAGVSFRDARRTVATIHINFRGIRQSFTTENTKEPGREMHIRLVDGPFKALDGTWLFTPLSAQASKVEFRLRYEFSSRMLEKLVGPVFHHIASSFVDAFIKRAQAIHGRGKNTA